MSQPTRPPWGTKPPTLSAWLVLCASRSYARERNVALFTAGGLSMVTMAMFVLATVFDHGVEDILFWLPAIVYLILVPLAILSFRADKRAEASLRPTRSREVRQSMDILKTSIALGGANQVVGADRLALLDEAAGYSLRMWGVVESLRKVQSPSLDLARRAFFAAERSMYEIVQGAVSSVLTVDQMRATVATMREAACELEHAVDATPAIAAGPQEELRSVLGEMQLLSAAREELNEEDVQQRSE